MRYLKRDEVAPDNLKQINGRINILLATLCTLPGKLAFAAVKPQSYHSNLNVKRIQFMATKINLCCQDSSDTPPPSLSVLVEMKISFLPIKYRAKFLLYIIGPGCRDWM